MTGDEAAREFISVPFAIKSDLLLAGMRDGASVNNVAIEVLKAVYPEIFYVFFFHLETRKCFAVIRGLWCLKLLHEH